MFYDYEQEDYDKGCKALFERCRRRMWFYRQPNRYDTEQIRAGIIIFRTGDELGRNDTHKGRLIPVRGD